VPSFAAACNSIPPPQCSRRQTPSKDTCHGRKTPSTPCPPRLRATDAATQGVMLISRTRPGFILFNIRRASVKISIQWQIQTRQGGAARLALAQPVSPATPPSPLLRALSRLDIGHWTPRVAEYSSTLDEHYISRPSKPRSQLDPATRFAWALPSLQAPHRHWPAPARSLPAKLDLVC
jgi:hypothetical protein